MERSGSLNEIVALWIGIIREKSFVIGIDGGRSMGGGAILIKIIRPLDETLVLQRTVGISCFQIK